MLPTTATTTNASNVPQQSPNNSLLLLGLFVNSPPFVDSNLDYLISKMPSRGSLLWVVIVLRALVDNKATIGKAELEKGEKEWRKNIVGDKQGMFLFLFLFFNYTN